ncbi:MAG TPA: nucleotidyltransferase [Opitutae bacterium]|nr:nucleotidyltransferase [Opitutae bacterium]
MAKRSLQEKTADFDKALQSLQRLVDVKKPDDVCIDAAIQRFEYTYELSWKTLKTYIEERLGESPKFPKQVLSTAYQANLIDDETQWLTLLNDRNLTSHLYSEAMSRNIFSHFKTYVALFQKLLEKLRA